MSRGGLGGSGTAGWTGTQGDITQGTTAHNVQVRAFIESYVLARTGSFTKGNEPKEAWQAVQDAKKLYQMIHGDTVRQELAMAEDAQKAHTSNLLQQWQDMKTLQTLSQQQAELMAANPLIQTDIGGLFKGWFGMIRKRRK